MDSKVQRAMEMVCNQQAVDMIEYEYPRLWGMLKMLPEGRDRSSVLRALTVLNQQLLLCAAAAAKEMGYPPEQGKWPETDPVEAVGEMFPEVLETPWYQRMLMEVVMPSGHPWFTVPTET